MTSPTEPTTVHIKTSSDITIVADHWPGDGPAIVMAHGGGQTRHSWGRTAGVLAAAGHRLLSIDLRGHGNSSWSTSGDYLINSFRDDAMSVIDWLDEPVAWVGASLGGSTGLAAVDAAPQRFWALVLVDITPAPAQAGIDRIMTFMVETAATGFADLDEAADAVAAYQPHRTRPKNSSGLAKNLQQGEDGRWRWHWDPAFVTSDRSMTAQKTKNLTRTEAARRLRLPTMLVRGQLSDLVTEAEARAFLELVPHAVYVDVKDASHMIAGDENDAFTSAVVEFFRELA